MTPTESEVMYRGTAAGTDEQTRQWQCTICRSIFDPVLTERFGCGCQTRSCGCLYDCCLGWIEDAESNR